MQVFDLLCRLHVLSDPELLHSAHQELAVAMLPHGPNAHLPHALHHISPSSMMEELPAAMAEQCKTVLIA